MLIRPEKCKNTGAVNHMHVCTKMEDKMPSVLFF